MKRIHLFEFEDISWFPRSWRSYLTRLLVVLHRMMGLSPVIASELSVLLKQQGLTQIVDLGSGSGGMLPSIREELVREPGLEETTIVLTDKFPEHELVSVFQGGAVPGISYCEESVDATQLDNAPEGLKTMMNVFHHLPPSLAREVLRSAQENKQSLFVYEMGTNPLPIVVWWLLLPVSLSFLMLMSLVMTLFVRPLRWQQLVLTYLVPILPFCYAWDGQVSLARIYNKSDLQELLATLPETDEYVWEIRDVMKDGKPKGGLYLFGKPVVS